MKLTNSDLLLRMWQTALMVAYVALQLFLLILFAAYFYEKGPFGTGTIAALVFYELFLSILPWLLNQDCQLRKPGVFTSFQGWTLVATLAACASMSVVAIVDVSALGT